MTLSHAVAFVDHHRAEVLQFSAAEVHSRVVHAHGHITRQHHSGVRTEHAFFDEVCNALDGIAEVLVTGGHTGLADFRHFVDKHRRMTSARIVGYEVVDHPTENQLVALARKQFVAVDAMRGIDLPN